ncbi:MAG: hypothetical protein JWM99_2464 [Verrucomicrobiales bacterium]|nr:hypothetical protein [Verrucomicrobiales bacterium]
MNARKTWSMVVIYAIAMAWVESAVVVYLRTLLDRIQPYQKTPLPHLANFGSTELIREAATLIMLAAVGFLSGNTTRKRLGYSLIAFGVWDIFYYLFLQIICGWPKSLLDWDILFLIPLPWWGPVIAPMLIAMLMIIWGSSVTVLNLKPRKISNAARFYCTVGVLLALYVFMQESLGILQQGEKGLREMLPTHFSWLLFSFALLLMAAPILNLSKQTPASDSKPADGLSLRDATNQGSGMGLIS